MNNKNKVDMDLEKEFSKISVKEEPIKEGSVDDNDDLDAFYEEERKKQLREKLRQTIQSRRDQRSRGPASNSASPMDSFVNAPNLGQRLNNILQTPSSMQIVENMFGNKEDAADFKAILQSPESTETLKKLFETDEARATLKKVLNE